MDLTAAWNGETGKLQRQAPETSLALLVNPLTQWNSQLHSGIPSSLQLNQARLWLVSMCAGSRA
jgi:hypothetical protein